MANPRDVQKEIDTLFKGTSTAIEEFNDVKLEFEETMASGDRIAKEKIDAELNKFFRKIVNIRQEVVRVARYKTIKDSSMLEKMRDDLEACMRFFRTNHKVVKEKPFSEKGRARCAAEENKNPKTRTTNWLQDALEELGYNVDELDYGLEEKRIEAGADAGKKKAGSANDPLRPIRERLARVRFYRRRLEVMLRMVELDEVEPSLVDDTRGTVTTFVQNCTDFEFEENDDDEMVFEPLGIDEDEIRRMEEEEELKSVKEAEAGGGGGGGNENNNNNNNNGKQKDDSVTSPSKEANDKDASRRPKGAAAAADALPLPKSKTGIVVVDGNGGSAKQAATKNVAPNVQPAAWNAAKPLADALSGNTSNNTSAFGSRTNTATSFEDENNNNSDSKKANKNKNNISNTKEINSSAAIPAPTNLAASAASPKTAPSSSVQANSKKDSNNDKKKPNQGKQSAGSVIPDDDDDAVSVVPSNKNNSNDNDNVLQGIYALGIAPSTCASLKKFFQMSSDSDWEVLGKTDLNALPLFKKNPELMSLLTEAVALYKEDDSMKKLEMLWNSAGPNGKSRNARIAVAVGAFVDAQTARFASDPKVYPTPFCEACKNQNFDTIRVLAGSKEQGGLSCNLDILNVQKQTQLMLASFDRNKLPLVNVLLEMGCNPFLTDENGRSPLFVAAQDGFDEIVRAFCDAGQAQLFNLPNLLSAKDRRGTNALMTAAKNGHRSCVEILLLAGADPNAKTNAGLTALHLASGESGSGQLACIKVLLGYKNLMAAAKDKNIAAAAEDVDPNIQDRDGRTPLMSAIEAGNVLAVDEILKTAAEIIDLEIACENEDGKTALFFAASSSASLELLPLLLNSGADPATTVDGGVTLLMTTAAEGMDANLRLLIDHVVQHFGSVSLNNNNSSSKKKSKNQAPTSAKESQAWAVLNAKDGRGITALNYACRKMKDNVVFALLSKASTFLDVDLVDEDGFSPLARAVEVGAAKIVRMLLEAGAKTKFEAADFSDLHKLARARGQTEVATVLEENDKRPLSRNKKILVVGDPSSGAAVAHSSNTSSPSSSAPSIPNSNTNNNNNNTNTIGQDFDVNAEIITTLEKLLDYIHQNNIDLIEGVLKTSPVCIQPKFFQQLLVTPSQRAGYKNLIIFAAEFGRHEILEKLLDEERIAGKFVITTEKRKKIVTVEVKTQINKKSKGKAITSTAMEEKEIEEEITVISPPIPRQEFINLKKRIVNYARQQDGLTALSVAVATSKLTVILPLIFFGADVNKETKFGMRPLHGAAMYGQSESIKLLLENMDTIGSSSSKKGNNNNGNDNDDDGDVAQNGKNKNNQLDEEDNHDDDKKKKFLDINVRAEVIANQENRGRMTPIMACSIIMNPALRENREFVQQKVRCIELLLEANCSLETGLENNNNTKNATTKNDTSSGKNNAKGKNNSSAVTSSSSSSKSLSLSEYFSLPDFNCPQDFADAVDKFTTAQEARMKQIREFQEQIRQQLAQCEKSEVTARSATEGETNGFFKNTKKDEEAAFKEVKRLLKERQELEQQAEIKRKQVAAQRLAAEAEAEAQRRQGEQENARKAAELVEFRNIKNAELASKQRAEEEEQLRLSSQQEEAKSRPAPGKQRNAASSLLDLYKDRDFGEARIRDDGDKTTIKYSPPRVSAVVVNESTPAADPVIFDGHKPCSYPHPKGRSTLKSLRALRPYFTYLDFSKVEVSPEADGHKTDPFILSDRFAKQLAGVAVDDAADDSIRIPNDTDVQSADASQSLGTTIQPPGITIEDDAPTAPAVREPELHSLVLAGDVTKLMPAIKARYNTRELINARDWRGTTALYTAIDCSAKPIVVQQLLQSGADPNVGDSARDTFPLFAAIKRKDHRNVELLLKERDKQIPLEKERISVDGLSPITMAVITGCIETVQLLVRYGFDFNVQDQFSLRTPLHIACQLNQAAIAKYLVSIGAFVNLSDQDGKTPLLVAAQFSKDPQVVRAICLRREVDLEHPCNSGCTPVAYAIRCGRSENARVLLEFGAELGFRHPSVSSLGKLAKHNALSNSIDLIEEYEAAPANILIPELDSIKWTEPGHCKTFLLSTLWDEWSKEGNEEGAVRLRKYDIIEMCSRYYAFSNSRFAVEKHRRERLGMCEELTEEQFNLEMGDEGTNNSENTTAHHNNNGNDEDDESNSSSGNNKKKPQTQKTVTSSPLSEETKSTTKIRSSTSTSAPASLMPVLAKEETSAIIATTTTTTVAPASQPTSPVSPSPRVDLAKLLNTSSTTIQRDLSSSNRIQNLSVALLKSEQFDASVEAADEEITVINERIKILEARRDDAKKHLRADEDAVFNIVAESVAKLLSVAEEMLCADAVDSALQAIETAFVMIRPAVVTSPSYDVEFGNKMLRIKASALFYAATRDPSRINCDQLRQCIETTKIDAKDFTTIVVDNNNNNAKNTELEKLGQEAAQLLASRQSTYASVASNNNNNNNGNGASATSSPTSVTGATTSSSNTSNKKKRQIAMNQID